MMNRMLPASTHVMSNIRALRGMKRLSAQKLAAAITAAGYPIARTVLANYETGRKESLPLDFVIAAAQVLDTTVVELIDGTAQCPQCKGRPPKGFTCNNCGTPGTEATS